MNRLDFEDKRSEVQATARPNAVKNHMFGDTPFRQRCIGEVVEGHLNLHIDRISAQT